MTAKQTGIEKFKIFRIYFPPGKKLYPDCAQFVYWYSDLLDMESIAAWTWEQVEESVRFYIAAE